MTTLYLHFGLPKTGTTSIQRFMSENRDKLADMGICYPLFDFRYRGRGKYRNLIFLTAPSVDSPPQSKEKLREEKNKIHQTISELAETYPKILLSDESVWNRIAPDTHRWKSMKRFADKHQMNVKIIVYVRTQDQFVESLWRQKCKMEFETPSWDPYSYISIKNLDYYKTLNTIANVYGKENIIVRRFGKEYFGGSAHNLISDFLDILGLELTDDFVIPDVRRNLTLRASYIDLRRRLMEHPNYDHDTDKYIRGIFSRCERMGTLGPDATMFTPEQRKAFMAQFAESNQLVADEFLGLNGQPLFTEKLEEKPIWGESEEIRNNDYLQFLLEYVIQSTQKIQTMDQELKEVKGQLKQTQEKLKEYSLWHQIKYYIRRLFGGKK